jgi:uncharacterized coiled-coil DUF342 family protein
MAEEKIPNWEKYPEIWAKFDEAREALKPLMAKRQKALDERKALGFDIQKIEDKREALHNKACEDIEQIRNLREIIGRYAKAMGATSA